MSISEEQAKAWAEHFIRTHNEFYEYSDIYEDEDFTEEVPSSKDWIKVHDLMTTSRIEVSWDE